MWPFRRQSTPQKLYLAGKELEVLQAHGLPPGSQTYVTAVSGFKDTRGARDSGRLNPLVNVSCAECARQAWWGKGDLVTEKHWHPDPDFTRGLRLSCLGHRFMFELYEAGLAIRYPSEQGQVQMVEDSRLALVRAEVSDIISVQTDPLKVRWAQWRDESPPLAPLDIETTKLKVLDVVDLSRLVPEESLLDAIFERSVSGEWRREWHRLLDATQPRTWREFLTKLAGASHAIGIDSATFGDLLRS
jgi:hypothetical protein